MGALSVSPPSRPELLWDWDNRKTLYHHVFHTLLIFNHQSTFMSPLYMWGSRAVKLELYTDINRPLPSPQLQYLIVNFTNFQEILFSTSFLQNSLPTRWRIPCRCYVLPPAPSLTSSESINGLSLYCKRKKTFHCFYISNIQVLFRMNPRLLFTL